MTTPAATFPLEEYDALRSGFGVVELVDWSSVTLTGADRQAFLNNFCTNDVKRLGPGEQCEAFITNVKGKILGHGLVHCRDDELVFITVPEQAAKIIEHLDRYIIREDVQLRDTTAERAYLLIAGGEAAGKGLTQEPWIHWRLLNVPFCGLLEAKPDMLSQVRQELTADGATPCGGAAFDALRIESGSPLFGIDFDEENLPQEVGRDELAISFTKGCYLGQETVARIDALGHVNEQLAGVRFAGPNVPEPNMELTSDGKPAGHVTSASFSPQCGAPLALAMVRRRWLAPGSQLESAVGSCEVIELPVHQ
ncbi:MAG: glycine cleavage T C-terminal barrel domain-containing protein [Pirellulales bacterium]